MLPRETFWVVVGDNTDSTREGRIYDESEAIEIAEMWARTNPGTTYYVMKQHSVSIEKLAVVTTVL